MLSALLSFLSGFLAKLITEALADWRRDKALEAKGAAETAARINKEAADAEARMREANARPRGDGNSLGRLHDGTF